MKRPKGFGRCASCNVPLLQRGGYAATGLCGPCCTGEADTLLDVTPDGPTDPADLNPEPMNAPRMDSVRNENGSHK